MKRYILVRINTSEKTKLILKLNKINVNIRNIKYGNKYVIFEVLENDIKRIKKYLVSYKLEIIDETGIYKLKKELRKNMLFIISIIFSVLVFLILTNIIVEVNIIHESKEIRELLDEALNERGVKKLTFKKSYDEYEHIIEEIKNNYKDRIEWLEIDVEGMTINVRVEERIITNKEENYNTCHIVASKSGIIKSIITERGIAEVKINDYVKKDDILINGMIKLNEEIKNNVCASGNVYAEVWYTVNASLPVEYEKIEHTGKKRYNFMVKSNSKEYIVFKSRVNDKESKNIKLFKLFGLEFYIQKEYEIKKKILKYSEEEALNKLIQTIHEKLIVKGTKIEDIINEKVLKKSINNGKLDIDMFLSVKEQIGVVKYYDVEMDSGTNDEQNYGHNN